MLFSRSSTYRKLKLAQGLFWGSRQNVKQGLNIHTTACSYKHIDESLAGNSTDLTTLQKVHVIYGGK
jgi:hypothetical protein